MSAVAQFTDEELIGKINPAANPNFVEIEPKYCTKSDIYLRKEAYDAFVKMHRAAADAGIQLTIISATRSFDYQKRIWEDKWKRPKYMGWQRIDIAKDILSYSSMPGTSRHHWGTDIDLNSLDPEWFNSSRGQKTYKWLVENGPKFGFYQVYTSKDTGRTGYNEEKWHWSYLPLAEQMLEAYNVQILAADIKGFDGATLSDSIDVIGNYVNGVEKYQH